ncbi:MAG TPA: hypothetical protein VGH28_10665 [Polyangiaceae bacterium]|jgi:hypothetical protein
MKARRTRVVPSLVLSASFVGVIPVCALQACGGTETAQDGGSDAKVDGVAADAFQSDVFLGVAACCFDAMSVADSAFVLDASSDAPEGG